MCFFFNDTATTEIYTLSLHDALPISRTAAMVGRDNDQSCIASSTSTSRTDRHWSAPTILSVTSSEMSDKIRSEEHTSELQSQSNLVCRLLLEKKQKALTLCHHHPRNR